MTNYRDIILNFLQNIRSRGRYSARQDEQGHAVQLQHGRGEHQSGNAGRHLRRIHGGGEQIDLGTNAWVSRIQLGRCSHCNGTTNG